MIRVGRVVDRTYQDYPGFTPIVVTTASSEYGALSPYYLRDEKGRILENYWQGSKVYPFVPATIQRYSRWNSRIIWEHPTEIHCDDQKLPLPAYWAWRHKLMHNQEAVRYPVGYHHRHTCLYSLKENKDGTIEPRALNYIEARKEIYRSEYIRLVQTQPLFKALQEKLKQDENLSILLEDPRHPYGHGYCLAEALKM